MVKKENFVRGSKFQVPEEDLKCEFLKTLKNCRWMIFLWINKEVMVIPNA